MTNDMTRGNPVRLILAFMIPTFLGNIFQQFYNLVDSVVAGRYIGVEALAAIGSTTSLIFLVSGWLQGITSGFSIMVAQCFGAGDYKQMRRYVAMSVYLCVAFVVVMTAGLMIFNVPVLRLMNTPDEILTPTAAYMSIIYAGLCVTAAYNAFAAVLRALGDGRRDQRGVGCPFYSPVPHGGGGMCLRDRYSSGNLRAPVPWLYRLEI